MEYHLGDSIAIGSGRLEFEDKENPQVELYADRMSRMSGTENYDSDMELLDEAGNISSGLALKKHNDVLKYGKKLPKTVTHRPDKPGNTKVKPPKPKIKLTNQGLKRQKYSCKRKE